MDLSNNISQSFRHTSLQNLTATVDGIFYTEKWLPAPFNLETAFEISSFGRVKSLNRMVASSNGTRCVKEKIVKPFITKKGYLRICLSINGVHKNYSIHILVATAFLGRSEHSGVNHKNYIKTDNFVNNLEWMSSIENAKDAWIKNKVPYQIGFDASNVSFTREQVEDMYNSDLSVAKLSQKYNRPYNTIYSIKSGHVFKEITKGISNVKRKQNGFN